MAATPEFYDSELKRAVEFHRAGNYQAAVEIYSQLLKNFPRDVALYFNLGCALQDSYNLSAAEQTFRQAISLDPCYKGAYNNLGNCLKKLGKTQEAITVLERAMELDPDNSTTRMNLALAHYAAGELNYFWKEYENRFQQIKYHNQLRETHPAWNGEMDVLREGARLFVYGAQGLGDELQCLRYLKPLIAAGARIVLEIQTLLYPLVKNLPDLEQVIRRGDSIPEFDYYVEFFSLPLALKTNSPRDIPDPLPLPFDHDNNVAERIALQRKSSPDDHLHAGVVWTGNPSNPTNAIRSMALEGYLHLAQKLLPDKLTLYSLQKGRGAEKKYATTAGAEDHIVNLAPLLTDFASTATAIDNLDFVFAIDSAVAHLVGVQDSKKLCLLLPYDAEWRWSIDQTHTPWYPGARLFRQAKPGDWGSALESLSQFLCLVRTT